MKKLVVLMLCLIMALGSMSSVYAFGLFDEAVAFNLGETVNSAITAEDKHDEYEITLPSAGVVTINLTSQIDKIALKLYDPDEFELWRNIPKADANGQVTINEFVCLTGGTYYLQVAQAYQGGFGDYSMTISLDAATEDFPESMKDNNNASADADQIQINKVYTGFIAANDITDTYKVAVDANTTIVVVSQANTHTFYVGSWHTNHSWDKNTRVMRAEMKNFPQSGTLVFSIAHPSGPVYDQYDGAYAFYVTNGIGAIEGIEKMDQITALHTTEVVEEEAPATPAPATITVKVDGTPVEFDQPPVLENDRTLVPLRAIFEALGATVEWEDATQTVTAAKGDIAISLQIGSTDMYVNGEVKVLDVPAKLLNSRTLVPVRAISEAFGCTVDWEDATQTVIITQ